MSTLRIIKRRIRSVQSTQKITRAMEMMAAARLVRARNDAEKARPYGATMAAMLGHLAGNAAQFEHPLFTRRETGSHVLVVFGSDRGLCGAFNTNLIRQTSEFCRQHRDDGVKLIFVGRKCWDFFRRRDFEILELYRDIGTAADFELAQRITNRLLEIYLEGADGSSGDVQSVQLLYTKFISTISRRPVIERLLSIEPPQAAEETGTSLDYIFEPSAERIFRDLLPRFALVRVMTALLESFASEHSARMVAMSSATKNAEEMIDSLVLQRNRIRQATITKEIAELVGGAEALA
ncbi:MAG: ATP synthase F1 subunit gamma [Candidatus Eiseniibacteriota bacterium]|jgi:F-type H+-transporting ATPase subunit gamma